MSEDTTDTELVLEDEEPVESGEEIKGLIVLNSDQTYGVVLNRSYVTLYVRKLYREDTEITFPVKGGGMESKTYFAGQYGPWMLSERPYPSTFARALRIVYEWMIADGLADAGDFGLVFDVLELKAQDIIDTLTALSPEDLTPKKSKKRSKK